MKIAENSSSEDKQKLATTLAGRLNAAKHRLNAPAVLRALKIPTGNIAHDIEVNWHGGKMWAGAGSDEFAMSLGSNEGEAEKILAGLNL